MHQVDRHLLETEELEVSFGIFSPLHSASAPHDSEHECIKV